MNTKTLKLLARYLSPAELTRLRSAAQEVSNLEMAWSRKLVQVFESMDELVVDHIVKHGKLPPDSAISFVPFYMYHSLEVMKQAIETAQSKSEKTENPPARLSSAFTAKTRLPVNLAELMTLWDHYRKRGKVPKRQKVLAEKVRQAYLKKVHSVWEKHSADFREGGVFNQEQVRQVIQKASKAPYARAKMIVETETTHYYNQVRRQVYDQSADVTHYLYVAIRDHATTHWCKTRNGIVYKKGSAYLEKETPPVHWNCRSEILPLTAQNPRHLALIQNRSLWRENRSPAPLPRDWNRKAA